MLLQIFTLFLLAGRKDGFMDYVTPLTILFLTQFAQPMQMNRNLTSLYNASCSYNSQQLTGSGLNPVKDKLQGDIITCDPPCSILEAPNRCERGGEPTSFLAAKNSFCGKTASCFFPLFTAVWEGWRPSRPSREP